MIRSDLSSTAERKYKSLYIYGEDLGMASEFASYILKKGFHHKPWEKRGTIYLQQSAFTSSLIVFYSRPFTKSYGLPDFPKHLINFNKKERELHDKIIELRHKVYAHSDGSSYKVKALQFDDKFPTAILGAPFFLLSKVEVERIRKMIAKLTAQIYNELRAILD